MKTIKSIALALVLLVGTTLSATNPIGDKGKPGTAEQEIEKLLKYPDFVVEENGEAFVSFYVNDDNQVTVLEVEAECEFMQSFVKDRLHNQILENKLSAGQRYLLPVKIISKS